MATAVTGTQFARYDSVWSASVPAPSYPKLDRDLVTDVVVVGAGIAGLSVAYHLIKLGKRVVVLDDGAIGGGITSRTSAHLACAMDNSYTAVQSRRGAEITRLAAASHLAAIDRIEQIARAEEIACDFERVDGFLFLPPREKIKTLDHEEEAVRRAGVPVDRLERVPFDFFDTGACIRFRNQAQFHPLKYVTGLARAIERRGGQVFGDTHADRIEGGKNARVTAGRFTIEAQSIVVATNSPINDRWFMHAKMAPYMTYVIGARVPTSSVPRGLYWDMDDPYHYIRVHTITPKGAEPREILIVGGEDHKSGQEDTERRHARLERWARKRFPMIEDIEFRWAGQVMESMDGLAFIGRNPGLERNVYIATGDTGMGMTHGTIAGMLISDLIRGTSNPWEAVYDPSRKPVRAAGKFFKENANVARQYLDWVAPGEEVETDEIPPGSGAVIRDGLKKLALYRDARGALHRFSAVCPHLGCIVQWNPTERTWDCPCHGSRFDKRGEVINGPANRDLRPVGE